MGLTAGLDGREKSLAPHRDSYPGTSSPTHIPVLYQPFTIVLCHGIIKVNEEMVVARLQVLSEESSGETNEKQ
jgi:hypothetical protein